LRLVEFRWDHRRRHARVDLEFEWIVGRDVELGHVVQRRNQRVERRIELQRLFEWILGQHLVVLG
jgi:hypothetical protein